jgi:hypothetical protein
VSHWYLLDKDRKLYPVGVLESARAMEERTRVHKLTGTDPWAVGNDEVSLGVTYAGEHLGVRYGRTETVVRVSTVFLSLDHAFHVGTEKGPPLLFETMVFGLPDGAEYQDRYSTWEEAEAGHREVVRKLKQGESLE